MSTDRDTTRVVRSWLRTDEHESADRVLGSVLDQLDTTPQRRATRWPVRRSPGMTKFARLALGTAAVVAAAVLGISMVGGGANFGGPDLSGADNDPTPGPSADAALVREWVDAVNRGDADALLSMTAERVATDASTLAREDKVAEVLETWCPMTVDSVERVDDSFLMGVTFADNADSTCTSGDPGTSSTFVLGVRDGKVTRIP